ncbi:tetraacyldisaccharide 4'-kinase [Succinispira mobilis]|uniref:tetraacyldisaccharide 4'-kinase n=1 Tax=Succinispira mobilis TaxID=78120 RepID=UPI000364165F|nr:tetraacyldisaccharide 4'-kinase [Succinispira mobilis]
MYIIYNLLLIIVFIFLVLPMFGLRALKEDGFKRRFKQSLGFLRPEDIALVAEKNCIWIHGASVGEIVATSPLVKEIRQAFPNTPILVSAVTTGGYSMAKQIIPEATAIIYFPLDICFITNWVVERIKPRVFMPVETELWPNFLRTINQNDIPVMMVNGRISDKSVKSYKYLFGILTDMLESVDKFCMQSKLDAEYIIKLGAAKERVVVTGNTKFDQTYAEVTPEDKEKFLAEMALTGSYPIIVAGSTHPNEESMLLVSFAQILAKFPEAKLVIAPRKPGRVQEITHLAQKAGYSVGFRKELLTQPAAERLASQVILIDTIGELGRIYAVGDVVYVGGSLITHGGHNVLEPAAHAKPIVVGPHMFNFKDSHALLKQNKACHTVNNQQELTESLLKIVSDDNLRNSMGQGSLQVIIDNRGAAKRSIEYLQALLAGDAIHGKNLNYSINNATSRHITIEGGERMRQREAVKLYLYRLVHGKINHYWDYFILIFLRVASVIYELGVWTKLALYRTGILQQNKLDCMVISLGNITVGGTGKTPTAQKMAALIRDLGYRVVILNRGYRAHWDDPIGVVSDGKRIYMTAFEAGDEAYLLAKNLPGVPVVIGKDRAITGKYVVDSMRPDVIIMDDGYQHWQLARDLDIVLVDTLNMFGNNCLLPRGTLREPLENLDRANMFLLTKTNQSTEAAKEKVKEVLAKNNQHAIVFESVHSPCYFVEIADWYKGIKDNKKDLQDLKGCAVMAFSAIGNPSSFEQSLADIGVELVETIRYPDHHDYGMVEMQYVTERALSQKVRALITTEKDAVKIPSEFIYSQRELPLYILGIEVKMLNGEREFLDIVEEKIKKGKRK